MHSSKVAPRSPTQTSFSIEWLEAALHEGVNEGDVARESPFHGTLGVRTFAMKGVRTSTALYTT